MKRIAYMILPIRTVSEANSREHWHAKAKRHTDQKIIVKQSFNGKAHKIPLPITIKMTRVGKGKMDFDNLLPSLKYIRDAIADQLIPGKAAGRADDDPRLTWEYEQKIRNTYEVIIEFFQNEEI